MSNIPVANVKCVSGIKDVEYKATRRHKQTDLIWLGFSYVINAFTISQALNLELKLEKKNELIQKILSWLWKIFHLHLHCNSWNEKQIK